MLSATGKIQAELSEAIAVIGNSDFPKFWPDLLPGLKSSLETAITANDFASVNGILATLSSLFERFRCEIRHLYKRFRYDFKNNPVMLDLKYCLDNFAAPLLSTVESISSKINGVGCVATLQQLLEARRLCCMIFYSLNYLDVPEEFEDKADEWMNEFKNYISERYPGIEEGGDADCVSLVDEVRAAVCENISLYMEKKEKILQKHLTDFVEAVWSLVVVESASACERLTVSGLKFLSKSVDHELFGGDEILQRIVIPNLMLRDEDEELFEKNYPEFIRRDMEGNDLDTRRRVGCELLKGINKEKVRALIHHWLAVYAKNPGGNWKYKECAIYLVVSLATVTGGGCSISSDDVVIDVESFFRLVIVPELQSKDVDGFPMLKAAALKFFRVFRVLIPKHVAMPLVGDVVRYVGTYYIVVYSYAAICMEKLLLVKDKDKNGVKQARYTSMDIDPIHEDLLYNLVVALEKARLSYLLEEKQKYMLRCMMRVVEIADIPLSLLLRCMWALTDLQKEVLCSYPTKTRHFLFEAIASVFRRACESEKGDPCYITDIQLKILKSINPIWDGETPEFFPYGVQVLTQLVDFNRPPYPGVFLDLIDEVVLYPDFDVWERSANVTPLVRLLQSFLQQAPD